jgi:hypothetical protein
MRRWMRSRWTWLLDARAPGHGAATVGDCLIDPASGLGPAAPHGLGRPSLMRDYLRRRREHLDANPTCACSLHSSQSYDSKRLAQLALVARREPMPPHPSTRVMREVPQPR